MKLSKFKTGLLSVGLTVVAAFMGSAASAAPITNWDYSVSSVFLTGSGNTTFTAGSGCQNVSGPSITWGSCSSTTERSGIGITASPKSGTIATNGVASPANTYTHSNQPLNGSFATLKSATIQATLKLKPTGTSDSAFQTYVANYNIFFAETPNAAPCAVTSPTPCNDIWVLQGSLNNSFLLGGDQYYFSFFAAPSLAALTPLACSTAGAPSPCHGFTTVEGQNNAVNFMMAITSTPVAIPEPGSIALMGLGLVGLAGLRARRRQPQA